MKKDTWSFLVNPFLAVLRLGITNALKVAAFTDAALNSRTADTFYNGLYTVYHPLFDKFNGAVDTGDSQKGVQKGSTKNIDSMLVAQTAKVNSWDAGIQSAGGWAKGTPNYIACFPHGHKDFIEGKKIDKINAVNTLALTITNLLDGATPSVAFQAVIDDINNTYADLNDAFDAQQGEISDTGSTTDEAVKAGTACMNGLFAVYGAMVNKYPDSPDTIKPIFDVKNIMNPTQESFTDGVKAGATDFIFKRKLEPDTELRIIVDSALPLDFAMFKEKNDEFGDKKVTVPGMEERFITASQLGDVPDFRYFKVRNPDPNVDGHFTVEIITSGKGVIN